METESPFRSATRSTSPVNGGGKTRHPSFSSPVYGGGGSPSRSDGEPEGAHGDSEPEEAQGSAEPEGARILALARAWIGTPYRHQASLKGVGCDCLGLLRGVWRDLRGTEPEAVPPYSPDWSRGGESLRDALARHAVPVALADIAPGDVVLFRMAPRAPAKHCGFVGERDAAPGDIAPGDAGGGRALTLIHARQNHCVSEEAFTPYWRRKLAYAFRM